MRRPLFPIAIAACLLASAGLVALWANSYRHDRALHWGDAGRLTASRGQITLQSPIRDVRAHFIPNSPGVGALGFAWIGNEMIVPNITIPADWNMYYYGYSGKIAKEYRERTPPLILCGFIKTGTGTRATPSFVVLGWEASVPIWFAIALTMTLPVLAYARVIRRRQLARVGLCRKCGYDLRASTSRCPECGTPFIRWWRPREDVDLTPTPAAQPMTHAVTASDFDD